MGNSSRSQPDFATLLGALVALGCVAGGLLLEGGNIRDIAQPTAALMVLGGTLGAVLISTPGSILIRALRSLQQVIFNRVLTPDEALDEIIRLSNKGRKSGIGSLETDALEGSDPFLNKALTLAIDGTSLPELRSIMELDLDLEEMRLETEAKVFECAGGYAPTVGIIGAVLGLIQVMKHLENIDEVGRGIAVSFVATVYGVGLANLFLLPAAAKLKARAAALLQLRELTLEGVLAIVDRTNTTLVRIKLTPYLPQAAGASGKERRVSAPKRRAEPSAA